MAEKQVRDRELFAVFREETSIGVGDPYKDLNPVPERYKGKQFEAPYQPKGKGSDAMIDKNMKLTTPGDVYHDQLQVERIIQKKLGMKSIVDKPFMPSNVTPKLCGSGSMYGYITPPILDTDPGGGAALLERQAWRDAGGKRKIYAVPAKKGSYGYPLQDRTLGQTKFEYVADTYDYGRVLDRRLKAESRARFIKPFVATGVTGRGITPISSSQPPANGPASLDSPSGKRGGSAPSSQQGNPMMHSRSWKPSNPAAKGRGFGTISSIPYIPNPSRPVG
ncbi:hypothetical protein CEUSTIGMA_g10689.t1 [Chlamydomonas eustigma]|uniref:Cilia-and flagella-associated protein 96 n=1 Tax=Chlamydomonas eustigma TaxID=1157962 RepID=A0A250XJQ1_9CHLO|nr:hypothetical protein CEUSTIGMA_g10689.t1 [Chlamydomonas eustigma]|eukprot:GAX83263.1 hypothetical protein CEUSTIGMA_g10689.t1 [Chlamydomonas eustigma]